MYGATGSPDEPQSSNANSVFRDEPPIISTAEDEPPTISTAEDEQEVADADETNGNSSVIDSDNVMLPEYDPQIDYETVQVKKYPKRIAMGGVIELQERTINVITTINDEDKNIDILKVLHTVQLVIERMCDEVTSKLDDDDFVQAAIISPSLQHHVSTKLLKKKYFTSDMVMTAIKDAAQSNQTVKLGEGVRIEFLTVRLQHPSSRIVGGARYKCRTRKPFKLSHLRTSMVQIVASDHSCLARSIVVAKAKFENDPRYVAIRRPSPPYADVQGSLAFDLCQAAGVPWNEPCGLDEVKKFEEAIQMRIKVIAGDCLNQIVYGGNPLFDSRRSLYIYRLDLSLYSDNTSRVNQMDESDDDNDDDEGYHYDPIINIKNFSQQSSFVMPVM